MQQPGDLITAMFVGGAVWTMSVMEDGPDDGESEDSFATAQCEAARRLIEEDHVPLYGTWGTASDHVRRGPDAMVIFPDGTKVLATYKSRNAR